MVFLYGAFNNIIFAILALNVFYLLFFSIAAYFDQPEIIRPVLKYNKFAVFIPAYKGDDVIINTVNESFQQSYPRQFYDIIVIADSLKSITIGQLGMMPITLVNVEFNNSTKGKSINAGIRQLGEVDYDYAVILDIDNIMEVEFLMKINQRLQKGQLALQAHRVAKNKDTGFAVLDGVSEEINNHIFRRGHHAVGLSAALIGSAKAIDYKIFARLMKAVTAVGGFDKELEILLISRGVKIDYDHTALVYDEKVKLAGVFQNQRKRWMSAQVTFMRKYLLNGIWTSIKNKNLDFFDKCFQLILIPRVLCLGLLSILSLLFFIGYSYGLWFMILLAAELLALLLAIPKKYFEWRTVAALFQLPHIFVLMFFNVFKLKGVNKTFIHTPHGETKEDL